jgi:ABC-type glycerol-3-phosphate transport system substrate-binding protein
MVGKKMVPSPENHSPLNKFPSPSNLSAGLPARRKMRLQTKQERKKPIHRPLPTTHYPLPTVHRPLPTLLLLLTAYCLLLLAGCRPGTDHPLPQGQPGLAGVKLQLLVVDDPDLAKAVERMRGQWQWETHSEFTVRQADAKTVDRADALAADAAIIPSASLAPLAEKNLLEPLPAEFERFKEWGDLFDLLKLREAAWGGKVYAVPFGSPVFTLYYRTDLLDKIHRRPPKTWKEYGELSQLLAAEKPPHEEEWSGTLEPLAPGWAGLVLLVRAASYAKARESYSALFDIRSMKPLIAGPPFVRALEELVTADKPAAEIMLRLDPAGVRQAFWEGKCGMAMTWPSAAGEPTEKQADTVNPGEKSPAVMQFGIAELPGSTEVYSLDDRDWVARGEVESPRIPLLAVAGRLGVVAARSPHQDAAFRLLLWLSGEKNSKEICPASLATTLFRKSHQQKPRLWGEKTIPTKILSDYAEMLAAVMKREQWLAMRIPGREEYLTALDEAVRSAVRGEASPADALQKAAEQWRRITEKRGKEAQRKAYLHSLGLEE